MRPNNVVESVFSMMFHYISIFLRSVNVADIVDIAIISLLIYLLLVWLIRARAKFMFTGMAIVGGIYFVARYFGLYLTTMVLQGFFAFTLIMIVVIFQDDFRHFFESIAMLGVQPKRRLPASFGQNIMSISNSFANFSRKKTGALVIIRGVDPLDRHLEAGSALDGIISQPLLESLFDRHAPTHDGAVIIEGNRIARFGCYLPLSINTDAIGRAGTRHAAALGLAERVDALCLVVSEEDGSISVAQEGRMRHLRDAAHLDTILEAFYQRKFPSKKGNIVTRFLTKHLVEKIIAVILASGFWFTFAHHTELIRRDFVVPLEYRNLASAAVIKEPKPKEAIVTLSGTQQEFNLLKPQELKISLNMENVGDGAHTIELTKGSLGPLAGLSVVNIEPAAVTFDVYRVLTVIVPVELKTKGKVPSGVTITAMRLEPEKLTALISSTLAQNTYTIVTEPIDLKLITADTILTPALVVPPDIRFPDNKRPDVKVIVDILERDQNQTSGTP